MGNLRNKFFVFLLFGLFFISFASAISFDNVKNQKDVTFDGQSINGNKILEQYKPIEIKNAFGWGKTRFEGYISEHDEICGEECQSTIKIKTGQDGVLIDDIKFETLQKDGSWIEQDVRSYQFSYLDGKNWTDYNIGQEIPKGTYEVKLDAEKKPSRTVDWKIYTNGKWINSWAIWGASNLEENQVAQYKSNTQAFGTNNQSIALDSTGLNDGTWSGKTFNDGTVSGGVTIDSGAMVFDGVDGVADFGSSVFQYNYSNNYSISIWFKTNNYSSKQVLAGRKNGYDKIYVENGNMVWQHYNGSLTESKYIYNLDTDLLSWSHFVGEYNEGTLHMYYNGELERTDTISADFNFGVIDDFKIGEGWSSENLNGSISSIQIYDDSLTSSEVSEIYSVGKDYYSQIGENLVAQYSGRDFEGTTANPTTIYDTNQLVDGKINEGFTFDGADDYVLIPNPDTFSGNDEITISAWIKSDSSTGNMGVISQSTQILLDSQYPDSMRIVLNSFTTNDRVTSSGFDFFDDNWHMVTARYDGTNLSIWADGVKNNEVTPTGTYGGLTSSWRIGDGLANYDGAIDDVRIFNKSLTADEISYIYNDGVGTENTSDSFVTLNSPSDNQIIYNNPATFNATAEVTDGAILTNMSLWTNESGSWEANETIDIFKWDNGSTDTTTNVYTYLNRDNAFDEDDSTYSYYTFKTSSLYHRSAALGKIFDSQLIRKVKIKVGGAVDSRSGISGFSLQTYNGSTWSNEISLATSYDDTYFLNKTVSGIRILQEGWSQDYDYVSFYVYTLEYETQSETSTDITFDQTITDDIIIWNVQACDTDGDCGFAPANFTVFLDDEAPSINITAPINTLDYNYVGGNETLNVTFTDTNLESCWYFYGEEKELTGIPTPYRESNYSFTYNDVNINNGLLITRTIDYGSSETITEYFSLDSCETNIINATSYCGGLLSYSCENNFTCDSELIASVETKANAISQSTYITDVKQFDGSYNSSLNCSANETNFTYIPGQNNMTVYANDTIGNLNSEVIEWNYKVLENLLTFNNDTRAGDQEDFTLNITIADGYDLSSALFHYNGYTESPSIISSGNTRILTIDDYAVPLYTVNTNASIFFDLFLDNSTNINTTTKTQLVYAIFLDNCSSHTYELFNISLFDEKTKTPIVGDIEFNYNLLNKPAYQTINSLNLKFENVSNARICSDINLTDENFAQSIEIKYSSDGYVAELYNIQKADITEDTTQLDLFDLNSTESTEFLIKYQDDTLTTVEGAVVQLLRKYISEDAYETVEAPLTSSTGTAIVHIDLNTNLYKAIIVKDGVVLDIFDNLVFDCENELSGVCEQNLFGVIDSQNSVDIETINDFSYLVTSVNNTITTTFSIPSGNPSLVNILLKQKDMFGNTYLCNKTITSSGGSIDCDYNDTIGDSIISLSIYINGKLSSYRTYNIKEAGGVDWLDNNFFIVFVLLLSLAGMAITSPEWMIINSVATMVLCGGIWLLNGVDFVAGFGTLIWLLVSAVILIFKISKQEDR
jgi:hypothetical protein